MRRAVLWILAGVGILWAVRLFAPTGSGEMNPGNLFSKYHGGQPGLLVDFEYPKEWELQEEQGQVEKYRKVRLVGPRNAEDTYDSSISAVVYPLKKDGGRFEALDGLVRNFKEHQIGPARFEQEKMGVIGGHPAVDITVSTVIPPLLHDGVKPLEIPVKSRTIFFQRGESLYRITYSADSRMFDSHSKEFEHLLGSLQFR